MILNYFTIGMRNLLKRKGYTALNIFGLAIGIACCLLIFQYVSYERSYDTFQAKSPQIVRIRLDQYKQGKLMWQSATSFPAIAPTMKKDYPEVENYCRLIDDELLLSNEAKHIKFSETKGYYADPSAINMLDVQLISGSSASALKGPNKIILSQSMAKKYFGTDDVLCKTLLARGERANETFQVEGVFKDYPSNSHLVLDYMVSYATLESEIASGGDKTNPANTSFGWYDFYTYIQLKPGTDMQQFNAKLTAFANKYINSQPFYKPNNVKDWIYTIPFRDIHLNSNYNQEAENNGSGSSVNFMFLIGFIILAIAWINYINLSTARSVERAKEVGVRKVLGAAKGTLIRLFMFENVLLNFMAIAIAAIAVVVLTPWFNSLMGRETALGFSMSVKYWFIFSAMFAAGMLLSGLYPAFILSGYQPVAVLKGAFKNTSGGLLLRKSLIIVQFSISVILIAGTIIVYQQVSFMRNQKLGVDINQTLVLNGVQSISDSLYSNTLKPFKADLLKNKGVKSMAVSTSVMGKEIYWTNGFKSLDHKELGSGTVYRLGVDYDFIPQFQIKLLAGRNFSKDFPGDKKAAIINEKTMAQFGFKNPEEAIGRKISNGDTLTVVGVIQSFHHLGLQKPIDPQVITLRLNARQAYSIKLQTADVSNTIASIKTTWDKYFPNDPFNYVFLDDQFNTQYKSDQQFGKVFTLFASLAILIACFGLLGLSAYNILQRTKEVGIRKVLGASTKSVVYILSKDFMTLVVISFVISAPISWLVMHNWLQGFAYRINISLWVFAAAGIISVAIALCTISFQAVKAALTNPVKSLKSE